MEPASIRYKNPGAMWGSALAIKWGALKKPVVLNDGKGQGNNIAVFPTYVQGICAQLDLWRTSKNYRNKKFADAIAIWSGGNSVESYISFVLKRVPGMTRNTIMNDAFWQSPKGILFLKAQAWHEAGKPYPAPDSDWLEAQRRVFDDLPPAAAQASTNGSDDDVRSVQSRLKAMNYHPGEVDGCWGGMTAGAISAFINDRERIDLNAPTSMPEFRAVLDDLNDELTKAEAEGFTRPIAGDRQSATPTDLAPKLPEVKAAQNASFWSKVQGWFSATFGGVTAGGLVTNLMSAKDTVDPIKSWFGETVPYFIGAAFVIAVIVIAAILAKKATNAANESADQSTKAYHDGARL